MKEMMSDFDGLRTGLMSISQFRRCLSTVGLSALGKHTLTDPQFEMIVCRYRDAKCTDKIRWMDFIQDVERGTHS